MPYSCSSTAIASTSCSSFRRRGAAVAASASCSKAARRLKALEIEQSWSARKAQVQRGKALESFSRSLMAWLNFLLQNPDACGCKSEPYAANYCSFSKGKRRSLDMDEAIDFLGRWRCPKRQRGEMDAESDKHISLVKPTILTLLENSLRELCSLEDMVARMRTHMSWKSCSEVLLMLSQVCKNIDEGRLKMKSYCPLVTDVALREKAIKVLLCYDSLWLRIGLHILFGEFLKDSMHGEGDLLAHLVILGCKVNYEQPSLAEREFKVKNIFEDLQDGIVLCRLVHLLTHDASILSKVVSPSDTSKKNLQNCKIAVQFLKDYGVLLSDSDGVMITATDIANGDRELTCSMLWNVFVKMQSPLLISKNLLLTEIAKISNSNLELFKDSTVTEVELLLNWIQAVCLGEPMIIDNFSSLINGNALIYLIKFYFGDDFLQICTEKFSLASIDSYHEDLIRCKDCPSTSLHGIAYVQSVAAMLGNSFEVLHSCDILDHEASIDERSIVILLVFLTSRLISLNLLKSSETAMLNHSSIFRFLQLEGSLPNYRKHRGYDRKVLLCPQENEELGAYRAREISKSYQAMFRGFSKRNLFSKMKISAILLQAAARAWLAVRCGADAKYEKLVWYTSQGYGLYDRYHKCMTERQRFHRIKNYVVVIQRFVRGKIKEKQHNMEFLNSKVDNSDIPAATALQPYYSCDEMSSECQRSETLELEWRAASKIQEAWKGYVLEWHTKRSSAVIKIQTQWRCWSIRKKYLCQLDAVKIIHHAFRSFLCKKAFQQKYIAAIEIQRFTRGHLLRNMLLKISCSAVKIQSQWRCWSIRRRYLCQVDAIKLIQTACRNVIYKKAFQRKLSAAVEIQSFARRQLSQNKLLRACKLQPGMVWQRAYPDSCAYCIEMSIVVRSIIKLQKWWKKVLFSRSRFYAIITIQSFVRGSVSKFDLAKKKQSTIFIQRAWRHSLFRKMKRDSALVIQSCIRGWAARCTASRTKCSMIKIQRWWRNILYLKTIKKSISVIQAYLRGWITRGRATKKLYHIEKIQSCWKGYLVRKHSSPLLLDLRNRMRLSSANVVDESRLINRLVIALSELLGYRSITDIRHTCATLDVATDLSEKCCETLVAAGAIDILLKQIQLLNRGVPDQEVLKHVLSTLRNIARYKSLSLVLISTPRSMEIIFKELLRNKNEGFWSAVNY
ncbi:hypothetical protein HPP92_012397 [Vanilla planifolia]|uniref:Calponin-homology (CH) domain-containing protein n=1 Tax=Vanilla planifolia TaxID=51239 RepID=A0A835UZC4_VANPL|nr:hypothetical protein HPP92_012397 [Vanilla planifolia]